MSHGRTPQQLNNPTNAKRPALGLLGSLLWLMATVVLVLIIAMIVSQSAGVRPRSAPVAVTSSIKAEQVVAQIQQSDLDRHLNAMQPYPTRVPGSAGIEATAQHIRATFERLGMMVVEQPVALTVPVTRYCRIRDDAGREIQDV